MTASVLRSEVLELEDSIEAVTAAFESHQWSDGLPIVPPTAERVEAMLRTVHGDPAESLGRMPPLWGNITLEKLAINSVMAGCLPQYFPIVVTAVEAMLAPEFNLYGIQATTHSAAPLIIVNGPIANAAGMNSGPGVFGPGWKANATIGRAIRLILINVGGAWPGRHDMATQGQPGKFTYCIAENEAANPWSPLHVDRGFDLADSTVTVFGGEGPHNVNDHVHDTAGGVLGVIADAMATLGSNPKWFFRESQFLIVLGPEHAATIAADGLSKRDVQEYCYQNARVSLARLKRGGMWGMQDWPRWMQVIADDQALLPVVPSPEDILVVVAGGAGKHSSVIPNVTINKAVTRRISRGKPISGEAGT